MIIKNQIIVNCKLRPWVDITPEQAAKIEKNRFYEVAFKMLPEDVQKEVGNSLIVHIRQDDNNELQFTLEKGNKEQPQEGNFFFGNTC